MPRVGGGSRGGGGVGGGTLQIPNRSPESSSFKYRAICKSASVRESIVQMKSECYVAPLRRFPTIFAFYAGCFLVYGPS